MGTGVGDTSSHKRDELVEIDGGEIILQREIPVYSTDTAVLLQERVLEQEHILLPEAIQKIKEERKR